MDDNDKKRILDYITTETMKIYRNPNLSDEEKVRLVNIVTENSYRMATGQPTDAQIEAKQNELLDLQIANEKSKRTGMETMAYAWAYLMGKGKGPWEI